MIRGPYDRFWIDMNTREEKYVFLDVDGVLCIKETLARMKGPGEATDHLQEECVARFNDLIARTRAKIVVSSSWRFVHTHIEIGRILHNHGFSYPDRVIGSTPRYSKRRSFDPYEERSLQIAEWMAENGVERHQIVILDDDGHMGELQDRLVHIDQGFYNGGLLDIHVERAVELLTA